MMVMITQGDAQHFLGVILFDHETVQVLLELPWFVVELEVLRLVFRFALLAGRSPFRLGGVLVPRALKVLTDEFGKLTLKILRGGRAAARSPVHIGRLCCVYHYRVVNLVTLSHFSNITSMANEPFKP